MSSCVSLGGADRAAPVGRVDGTARPSPSSQPVNATHVQRDRSRAWQERGPISASAPETPDGSGVITVRISADRDVRGRSTRAAPPPGAPADWPRTVRRRIELEVDPSIGASLVDRLLARKERYDNPVQSGPVLINGFPVSLRDPELVRVRPQLSVGKLLAEAFTHWKIATWALVVRFRRLRSCFSSAIC